MKTISFILTIILTCGFGLAGAFDSGNFCQSQELDPKDKLIVETVLRLKDFDIETSAPAKAAILRYLRSQPGSEQYFKLIERFKPVEVADELARFSLDHADQTSGVRGAVLLFAMQQEQTLLALANGENQVDAVSAVKLIGHAGGTKIVPMLLPLLTDSKATAETRTAAVEALGRSSDGQETVLGLVTQGKLADELRFAAANILLSSENDSIAEMASKHLQLPATANRDPLPTVTELVKRTGNANAGKMIFRSTGTCLKCHKVLGDGTAVGPDLSEIGSKLSRDAMYVSILDPSQAISHNYETYALITDEGTQISGLLISETDEAVTLRTSEGIDKTVKQDTIEDLKKQSSSLMPQDLQKSMTVEQLVDLVEYLMTLRTVTPATR